jgi:hypothetical protein
MEAPERFSMINKKAPQRQSGAEGRSMPQTSAHREQLAGRSIRLPMGVVK